MREVHWTQHDYDLFTAQWASFRVQVGPRLGQVYAWEIEQINVETGESLGFMIQDVSPSLEHAMAESIRRANTTLTGL